MKYKLIRCSKSSYQDQEDLNSEKSLLMSIDNIDYHLGLDDISIADEQRVILITNTHTNLKEVGDFILERTDLIIHPNSGYDNFNQDWLDSWNIPVKVGHEIRRDAVVEYIVSGLMNYMTPIPDQKQWDENRNWPRHLLRDHQVTIIGHGHIGSKLHKILSELCLKVIVVDPYQDFQQNINLDSDIYILAAGLNRHNKHMLDKNFFMNLKRPIFLINTSRGELINEKDLIDYLYTHQTSSALIDVFESEPCDFSKFSSLRNIQLTSHIAGVDSGLIQRMNSFIYQNVKHFVKNPIEYFQENKDQFLSNRIKDGILI